MLTETFNYDALKYENNQSELVNAYGPEAAGWGGGG